MLPEAGRFGPRSSIVYSIPGHFRAFLELHVFPFKRTISVAFGAVNHAAVDTKSIAQM